MNESKIYARGDLPSLPWTNVVSQSLVERIARPSATDTTRPRTLRVITQCSTTVHRRFSYGLFANHCDAPFPEVIIFFRNDDVHRRAVHYRAEAYRSLQRLVQISGLRRLHRRAQVAIPPQFPHLLHPVPAVLAANGSMLSQLHALADPKPQIRHRLYLLLEEREGDHSR